MTQAETGHLLGISESLVRKYEGSALAKFRAAFGVSLGAKIQDHRGRIFDCVASAAVANSMSVSTAHRWVRDGIWKRLTSRRRE